MTDLNSKDGIFGWMIKNHVAANLLMMFIIVSGFVAMLTNRMELFTDIDLQQISVSVSYRGASPEEVEEGVCIKVEEAIASIDDIKKIYSTASEGVGTVIAELEDFADTLDVLDDIKAEVDRIETFPEETEKPIIKELENEEEIITVVVHGRADQKSLKLIAEQVRDDLTEMENISQVSIAGVPVYEISIEVAEEMLRRYTLTFDQIADIIRNASLDVPGGSVKTEGGEILFRTKAQKYTGKEFEKITVLTKSDGTQLTLGEIANVVDGFEDEPVKTRFNGQLAVMVDVFRVGKQDTLDIVETVKKYLKTKRTQIPQAVSLSVWNDNSVYLKSRLHLLCKNAMIGLVLVYFCLSFFLNLRLAFWTTMGIPLSFLGALLIMPMIEITINMISLYAFIICLGIVVDDAIVVGENIYLYRNTPGISAYQASLRGVKEMAAPVTAAVLTTIFAFMPLMFTKGTLGKFLRVIPMVVISVLMVSLLEALFLLPSHLFTKIKKSNGGIIYKLQSFFGSKLMDFVNGPFAKFVMHCVRWRYITFSSGIFIFLITLGVIKGGYIEYTFLESVDSDMIFATLEMPQGTPSFVTEKIAQRIELAAVKAGKEIDSQNLNHGKKIIKSIATAVGQGPFMGGGPEGTRDQVAQSHIASVNVELLSGEERGISSAEFANSWRKNLGDIAGISSLKFDYALFSAGDKIKVQLSHRDFDKLLEAVEILKQKLAQYPGVKDISDDFQEGKREIKLNITPQGETLGLRLGDLARQVRQGFYGEEIQRIQRGKNDVRVMLRYPEEQRKSLIDIENMRVRLSDGTEVPFNVVADLQFGKGYSTITRADRKRVINVSADVDETIANADKINEEIFNQLLPLMKQNMPALNYDIEGELKSRIESMSSLGKGFIYVLFAIFILLAIQFRSYTQPIIIMSAIPFGLIGAVVGHLIFNKDISLLSVFGIVALMGIVVNDSLIMVDLINRERKKDIPLEQVLRDSATRRFRPIILTTLTTFFGLTPMILEKSLQAQFLIPMAISLGFGVLFATCITLLLVPSLYMILEDFHRILGIPSPHAK